MSGAITPGFRATQERGVGSRDAEKVFACEVFSDRELAVDRSVDFRRSREVGRCRLFERTIRADGLTITMHVVVAWERAPHVLSGKGTHPAE